MSDAIPESPGARLVRRGSLRFVKRPHPAPSDAERLLVVGDHWESGAEVVLRVFDADESDYYQPGPVARRDSYMDEYDVARECGAALYDPDAADPPNRVGYTTCHEDYDHGCTVELERFECAVFPTESPRTYRKVLVRGGNGFARGQLMRYGNFTEEDPRATRDRFAAEQARRRDEEAAAAKVVADDEALLAGMGAAELRAERDRRESRDDGNHHTWEAVKRCRAALARREQADRDAEWAALQARVLLGATLLVPEVPTVERTLANLEGCEGLGDDARQAHLEWMIRQFGRRIAGTPAYLVGVVGHVYAPRETPVANRSVAVETDDGRRLTWSAQRVADLCAASAVDGWPPLRARQKLVKRLSSEDCLLRVVKYESGGQAYWVGTARFGSWEPMVLDGDARLVRRKAVVETAMAAYMDAKYGAK